MTSWTFKAVNGGLAGLGRRPGDDPVTASAGVVFAGGSRKLTLGLDPEPPDTLGVGEGRIRRAEHPRDLVDPLVEPGGAFGRSQIEITDGDAVGLGRGGASGKKGDGKGGRGGGETDHDIHS